MIASKHIDTTDLTGAKYYFCIFLFVPFFSSHSRGYVIAMQLLLIFVLFSSFNFRFYLKFPGFNLLFIHMIINSGFVIKYVGSHDFFCRHQLDFILLIFSIQYQKL